MLMGDKGKTMNSLGGLSEGLGKQLLASRCGKFKFKLRRFEVALIQL